jgi:hypothetical protein
VRFPIFIELSRSRLFLWFLSGNHGLAALGVLLTPWSLWLRFALLLLLGVSFGAAYRRWRQIPAGLILHPGGRLEIHDVEEAGMPPRPALLLPGATVLPMLCVFSWQEETDAGENLSRTLALFPDSAAAKNLRHLRVWLRTRGAEKY